MLRNLASIQPTRRPYCGSWNSTSTQSASSLSTCRNVPFAATRRGTLAPGVTKIGAARVTVAVGNGGAWIAPTARSAADINMNIQAPSMTFFSAREVIVPVESGYHSCGARGGSRQCNRRSASLRRIEWAHAFDESVEIMLLEDLITHIAVCVACRRRLP